MKFLCLDCDAPMKLHGTEGPDEGSLTITFRCPQCGFRVAMLTNPFETQMVRSLGVKIGGSPAAAAPFEHVRASMADPRPDVFEGAASGEATGAGCPFAEMLNEGTATAPAGGPRRRPAARAPCATRGPPRPSPWPAAAPASTPPRPSSRRSADGFLLAALSGP